ncbi:dephospho-CoA kinase [Clostridium bovifaecis]|uniref:Dephospho-CoA kinase n=1 Tax=Clostridium bovifaecis TaxID=2184719 RepID=A0A6I6ERS9_9CLOT|nr:dephospho-CoA kinase [Clostridium bovifaecis]
MIRVGLTGGIGSGKSTVSNILREKDIPIIDADVISREVLDIYPEILEKIKSAFGSEFIDCKGQLKRRELGNYVFKSEEQRKKLEGIIMPYIKKEIFERITNCDKLGESLCVIDAPTLIEHSIHKDMDVNILVWVDKDVQIYRVKSRDNLSEEQVLDRIKSQMPLEKKKGEVNFIIDNSGSVEHTRQQLEKILASIMKY